MILKIERYKDNQRWWIYDDIKKISISNMLYHSKHGIDVPETPDLDAVFLDVEPSCDCGFAGDRCSLCVPYYMLICRLANGEEFTIAFSTVAYLLNDSGKTIEKIVANYDPSFSFPREKKTVTRRKKKNKAQINTERKLRDRRESANVEVIKL